MISFNNLINSLEIFCESHPQISTFFKDGINEYEATQISYPAVVITPIDVQYFNGNIRFGISIFVCDRLLPDNSNLYDIISDTSLILNDIISNFSNQYSMRFEDNTPTASIGISQFADNVAGLTIENAGFILDIPRNVCVVPTKTTLSSDLSLALMQTKPGYANPDNGLGDPIQIGDDGIK